MAGKDYLKDLISQVKQKKKDEPIKEEKPQSSPKAMEELDFSKALHDMDEAKAETSSSQIKTSQKTEQKTREAKTFAEPSEVKEDKAPETEVDKELVGSTKKLLEKYGNVEIYEVKGDPIKLYVVPVSRPTAGERNIINTLKEAATRLITSSPFTIKDQEQRRNIYYQKIMEILRASPELRIPATKFDFYANAIVAEMIGYGLIDNLVKDDLLEEVMVIGPKKTVFVFHRKHDMMKTNVEFFSDDEIQDVINRIAREIGRRVDISSPLLDARLPDGSRINATVPPASVAGSTLTIRKFRKDPYSIVDLMKYNTVDTEAAAFLWLCVDGLNTRPANVLISGGTSSGKTTLLNVLCSFVPESERVISIEDTAELNLPIKHWIRMEARPPGLEGKGELTLDMLTKNALRMRPDRIIVGEVRHDEAFSLLTAMNTGHDGCLTGNALIAFSDGLQTIGSFVDEALSSGKGIRTEGEWQIVEIENKFANTLNDQGKICKEKVVESRRKPFNGTVLHIKTSSGNELTVTKNHPFYSFEDQMIQLRADELCEGMHVAAPAKIERDIEAIEPEVEYFSGLLHGDGHVLDKQRIRVKNGKLYLTNEGRVSLYTEEEQILPKYEAFLKNHFENTPVKKIGKRPEKQCFEMHMAGIKKSKKAQALLNIPAGDRGKAKLSQKHYVNALAEFLAGFFDAEGYVDTANNAVVFGNANETYVDFYKNALLSFGIQSRKYSSNTDGHRYHRLYVYGLENVRKFSECIPIQFPKKIEKLQVILNSKAKPNTNVAIVPCTQLIAKKIAEAKKIGMSERKIARDGGLSQGMIRFLKEGVRQPSTVMLNKLIKGFESNGINCRELTQLANAEIFWDKIIEVHEIPYNGFVYDLTMSEKTRTGTKPHNFVANGLIVGNSLGTVHANSAEETLVRLTNPPMNVPEVMLSGLNFIIVENLFHNQKRGTFRRITEIAEVTGVLEGKAKTQTVYKWDPVKDKLKRTNSPIAYLDLLQDYTGTTKDGIEKELNERTRFLERLQKENIRDMDKILIETEKFFMKRESNG